MVWGRLTSHNVTEIGFLLDHLDSRLLHRPPGHCGGYPRTGSVYLIAYFVCFDGQKIHISICIYIYMYILCLGQQTPVFIRDVVGYLVLLLLHNFSFDIYIYTYIYTGNC